jgi:hypothetical protein
MAELVMVSAAGGADHDESGDLLVPVVGDHANVEAHGYRPFGDGRPHVELQQHLFHFLRGKPGGEYTGRRMDAMSAGAISPTPGGCQHPPPDPTLPPFACVGAYSTPTQNSLPSGSWRGRTNVWRH